MSKTDTLIEKIIKDLDTPNYVNPDDIPNIDLYMDQVTTFMDKYLGGCKRNPEDKILTKTMINNYAKNHLLPPPEKKKYSENHLLILIFIYYLKGFLSINDIQTLIAPLIDEYYDNKSNTSLKDIYTTIFNYENHQIDKWKKELSKLNEISKTIFTDTENEDMLQAFSLISLLCFDVYMRKRTIETMIDELLKPMSKNEEKPEKKEKKSKKENKESKDIPAGRTKP